MTSGFDFFTKIFKRKLQMNQPLYYYFYHQIGEWHVSVNVGIEKFYKVYLGRVCGILEPSYESIHFFILFKFCSIFTGMARISKYHEIRKNAPVYNPSFPLIENGDIEMKFITLISWPFAKRDASFPK